MQVRGYSARGAFDDYLARSHFGDLDGLRCLCIAAVLWHHANPLLGRGPQLAQRGFMGVDFFFVLSGFLITTLLLRERQRDGRVSLGAFWRRRALRILPAYYLTVTVAWVYFVLVEGMVELGPMVPAYYVFLANFVTDDVPLLSMAWSLSVEEQYYALWPLLLVVLSRGLVLWVLLGLIGVNIAAGAGLFGIAPVVVSPLVLQMPNSTYAPILMGSLAAWALHRADGYGVLHRLAGWPGAAAAALAALIVAMQVTPADVHGWPNLVIHALMTLMVVALVINGRSALSPLLRQPLIARIGRVSYGAYLYHMAALYAVNAVLAPLGIGSMWVVLGLYAALTVGLADLSFRHFESRFLALRDRARIIPVRPAAPATSSGTPVVPGTHPAMPASPGTDP